ncbi:MAG: nitrile hydratase accessory protein [Hyphomicrobiales bacterium]|nr:nitrile hydratase accessory protein [Hyphomicrobiales bacterium]
MLNPPDLSILPGIPRAAEGPLFREPWEAQAFAMAVHLRDRGLFSWKEWAQAIGAEISAAQQRGDPDLGDTYYLHWLSALEKLVVAKGAASARALVETRDAWDRAARATPHGRPIELCVEVKPS